MSRKTARGKALDIPKSVKDKVWARDGGCCVVCGNGHNVMPNAHYIRRSQGGLGIEKNIITLCNVCHFKFDSGTITERNGIGVIIRAYLKSKYPDWSKDDLIYKKGRF